MNVRDLLRHISGSVAIPKDDRDEIISRIIDANEKLPFRERRKGKIFDDRKEV